MRLEHQKLWRWLAENPDEYKHQWPGWRELGINTNRDTGYLSCCFACAAVYGEEDDRDNATCITCPIKWTGGGCMSCDSEYIQWRGALCDDNHAVARALALKIADMWPDDTSEEVGG